MRYYKLRVKDKYFLLFINKIRNLCITEMESGNYKAIRTTVSASLRQSATSAMPMPIGGTLPSASSFRHPNLVPVADDTD